MDRRDYRTLILAGLLHDVGKLLNKPQPEPNKKHAEYGYEFLTSPEIATPLQKRFAGDVDHTALCDLVLFHDPYVEEEREPQVRRRLLTTIRNADAYSAGERAASRLYDQTASGDLPLDSIFTLRYLGRHLGYGLQGNRPQYRPAILSPQAAFPTDGQSPLVLTTEDYRDLQERFRAAYLHAVEQAQSWDELEAWTYSLLERFTWAVPSALHKNPRDVSLFDHSRTSCALAAALYLRAVRPKQDRGRRLFLLIKGDVSGVQDYIYSVANVGPGGVAKRLRARSFFITTLTEMVAHRLRDELVEDWQLPIAATIFAGGGQFVMLAPNLKSTRIRLEQIERQVNAWLWQEFQGDLAMVFGVQEVGGSELAIKKRPRGRNICQVLADLDHTVAAAKKHRLGSLLQENDAWQPGAFVWAPQGKDYEHGACPSCDRLPARAGGEERSIDERLCSRCYQDRLLSERIVEANCIAYYKGPHPPEPKAEVEDREADRLRNSRLAIFQGDAARYAVVLKHLDDHKKLEGRPYQIDGFGYEVPADQGPAEGLLPLVRHFANHVPRFDKLEELAHFCAAERNCVYGRYTDDDTCGILVRPDGSHVQSFPILYNFGCISAAAAEWPDGSLGSQLLGILRADMDHLGRLFSDSFEEEVQLSREAAPATQPVRSLSRLAALSRMTDLFFSGWVDHTLKHPPKGTRYDRIYTVYSGGDDLCLVGPWDVLVDFSRHLAAEFGKYVAGNSNVTLSAAITVTKPKFPIASSARLAGRWLKERAKDRGRNRLHLFGVTARWRDLPPWENLDPELKERLDEAERRSNLLLDDLWPWAELLDGELHRWREAGGGGYPMSAAFAHRLLAYAERAREWEEEGGINVEDLLYLAHLAYDLGRNILEEGDVSNDTKRQLSRLTDLSQVETMAAMRLPITYALYRNRERRAER